MGQCQTHSYPLALLADDGVGLGKQRALVCEATEIPSQSIERGCGGFKSSTSPVGVRDAQQRLNPACIQELLRAGLPLKAHVRLVT